jgi:hypothetical protein
MSARPNYTAPAKGDQLKNADHSATNNVGTPANELPPVLSDDVNETDGTIDSTKISPLFCPCDTDVQRSYDMCF